MEKTIENLHRVEKEKENCVEAEKQQATSLQTQEEAKDSSSETRKDNEEEKEKGKGNKSEPENSVDEVDEREQPSSSPKVSPLPRDHPSHQEDQEEIAKKAETLRDLTKVWKN